MHNNGEAPYSSKGVTPVADGTQWKHGCVFDRPEIFRSDSSHCDPGLLCSFSRYLSSMSREVPPQGKQWVWNLSMGKVLHHDAANGFFTIFHNSGNNAAGRKARRLFNSNHQCPSARPAHVLASGSIPNALLGVEALEPYSTLSEALGAYFKCLHLEPTPSPSLQVAKICKPDVHVKVWNSLRAKLPLAIFEKNIRYRSNSRTADASVHCRAPCHKMAKGLAVEDLTPRDTIPHRWQHLHQTWILRHRLV